MAGLIWSLCLTVGVVVVSLIVYETLYFLITILA